MLLHADSHAAVIEHAFEIVFEGLGFLCGALGEDVGGVLEVGELGAGFGGGGFAGVEDFGAEFGAGGAEEVCFLLFVIIIIICVSMGEGGGLAYVLDV